MTQLPTISIITVSYNAEKTIERTIQSVLNQNFQGKLEYIIIDGGSTDHTVDIIRLYEQDNIRWISEEDEGIYDAMNKGIQIATGDWIGILNSDDWYAKNALNIVGNFSISNPNIGFLIGKMARVSENMQFGKIVDPPDYKAGILKPNNHPSTFVKKDAYLKVGLFDLTYDIAADMELIMRAKAQPEIQMGSIDSLLAYMQEGGISNGFSGLIESYRIEKKYYGYISGIKVLLTRTLQKVRKKILQLLLTKKYSIYLQEKWWKQRRNSFRLSNKDYWFKNN
jgi:glycosyltransferase involved in cell wall biosynthesis